MGREAVAGRPFANVVHMACEIDLGVALLHYPNGRVIHIGACRREAMLRQNEPSLPIEAILGQRGVARLGSHRHAVHCEWNPFPSDSSRSSR